MVYGMDLPDAASKNARKHAEDIAAIVPRNTVGVEIGTISAINPTQQDSFEIHYRGTYNLRIAGGPIVYWSPAHRDYEILGVVKRNKRDAVRGPIDPTQEIVKSGVVEGYSIDVVVETIRENPPS